jgi:tRNA pseudouridine55 synthase
VIDGTLACGVVNLYKPAGITSFQAVSQVKRLLNVKKCGHAGTLDPDAEGVLPVFIGSATGACAYLEDEQKEYLAEILLGISTDTDDISGRVTCVSDYNIPYSTVEACIKEFTGEIIQKPPIYSAIKVEGRKLYEYARKNAEVEIPERKVTVYSITIEEEPSIRKVSVDGKDYMASCFKGLVKCSRGTYIRSLCRDIGIAAGTCGCMGKLVRTRSGPYRIEDSLRFEELQEKGQKALLPVADLFEKYEKIVLNNKETKDYLDGKKIALKRKIDKERQTVSVYTQDQGFIGLGELVIMDSLSYLKGKKLFCHPYR